MSEGVGGIVDRTVAVDKRFAGELRALYAQRDAAEPGVCASTTGTGPCRTPPALPCRKTEATTRRTLDPTGR
jgi:hypothetical protein